MFGPPLRGETAGFGSGLAPKGPPCTHPVLVLDAIFFAFYPIERLTEFAGSGPHLFLVAQRKDSLAESLHREILKSTERLAKIQ